MSRWREEHPGASAGGHASRRWFIEAVAKLSVATFGLPLSAGCGDRSAAPQRQSVKLPRVGYLASGSGSPPGAWDQAFLDGLRELGYREGENVAVATRFAEGNEERLAEFAAELVRLPVNVLVTSGPVATATARQATTTIPIVMAAGSDDPVGAGWITSYARPGGNLTGVAVAPARLFTEKLPALIKEAIPDAARVAILWNAAQSGPFRGTPGGPVPRHAAALIAAAQAVGLELEPVDVLRPDGLDEAFAAFTATGVAALWIYEQPLWALHAARNFAFAAER